MKLRYYFFLTLLFLSAKFYAQAPQMGLVILGNDDIADVNVDQDKFIAGTKHYIDIFEKEFKDIPATQTIGMEVVFHKTGQPDIVLHSKPKLSAGKEEAFYKKVRELKLLNTKILDFPMLITLNSKNFTEDFGVMMLHEKRRAEYERADFKTKYALTMKWAANEVLPVLGAYEAQTDSKFAGVKSFGTKVSTTDFNKPQDLSKLTGMNPDYWRAVMEMEAGNQLLPITKIFTLASQGQFDHALRYSEVVSIFSDPKAIADTYLKEWKWRMSLFVSELEKGIGEGIALHDAGKYKDAIAIYNELLKSYPNSAWARYEVYYSNNALNIENKVVNADDRAMWDEDKELIYACNPLYHMNVRASGGKEAYLLFRRQEVGTLFRDSKKTLHDVFEYADIALDLGVYDFAAQLFWYSVSFDETNRDRALNRYLYCLEKLEVPQWKANFEGDFGRSFKTLELEKEQTMKSSTIYKAMKN